MRHQKSLAAIRPTLSGRACALREKSAVDARTGRSKTFYATEALTPYLDENEDYLLAKDALEDFTQSDDDAIELADGFWPA
ncbi:hypothetical protein [Glaciihabitans sp. UYNi722]|uniref:hypothetical protein n=1 Tax=Glaciihabitans sp. UYNi722 TaxID=3156344 RepID=UPI0033939C01